MNKKLLIGIIVAAGVLFLATIVIVIIALRGAPDKQTNGNTNVTNTNQTVDQNGNTNSTSTTNTSNNQTNTNTTDATTNDSSNVVLSNERTTITRAALSFAERYGSFSSDNNFANITALESFMTDNMKTQAENLTKKNFGKNGEFYSIATQSISVTIVDFVEGATGATVEVDTRRTEQKGIGDPVIFSQTARMQLNKVDNQWKVDSFKWL